MATDKAGSSYSKTVNFTIDKTKPGISISGVSDGSYYNLDVTPVITITDSNLNFTEVTLEYLFPKKLPHSKSNVATAHPTAAELRGITIKN